MIKSIQALPGVTTAGEAATGFNVRGGSVDQNLILYDGMPVFNSSHVFGFSQHSMQKPFAMFLFTVEEFLRSMEVVHLLFLTFAQGW